MVLEKISNPISNTIQNSSRVYQHIELICTKAVRNQGRQCNVKFYEFKTTNLANGSGTYRQGNQLLPGQMTTLNFCFVAKHINQFAPK